MGHQKTFRRHRGITRRTVACWLRLAPAPLLEEAGEPEHPGHHEGHSEDNGQPAVDFAEPDLDGYARRAKATRIRRP